jgi:hypothetical protein
MTNQQQSFDHSQWRIDAREHLVLALIDFAQAAATLRRRLFVSNCHHCDNDGIARMLAAGQGYVICD